MENATQAETMLYIAEAMERFPLLDPLDATLKLAMAEATEACKGLEPIQARKAGKRENRDS